MIVSANNGEKFKHMKAGEVYYRDDDHSYIGDIGTGITWLWTINPAGKQSITYTLDGEDYSSWEECKEAYESFNERMLEILLS